MFTALFQALSEFFRLLLQWESPEAKRDRERQAMRAAIEHLLKERDALLLVEHPTDVDQARLGVVVTELLRVRRALADLGSRQ